VQICRRPGATGCRVMLVVGLDPKSLQDDLEAPDEQAGL
jgi:hypothetical protein